MRTGRHFPIPEGPRDLDALWAAARRLDGDTLPPWLDADSATGYRHVGTTSLAGLSPEARAAADDEFGDLELARLVVAVDRSDPDLRHCYVAAPRREPAWSIGLRTGPAPWSLPDAPCANPVLTATDVADVPASFVADPFLVRDRGRWLMFLEVMNWRTWKGEIGLAESGDGLSWAYAGVVLAEPFHLSYPQVFAADGETWMIPETSAEGRVALYRARRFPDDWEHAADLLAGMPFADATVARHAGRWWMFTETSGGRDDTLRLFHAAALLGPWHEHPRSPVVQGEVALARPAGRVVAHAGRLVRFAQDCGPAYGTAVRAVEITRLTVDDYAERPLAGGPVLGPAGRGWNAGGMHHVDAVPRDDGTWLAAVDGWCMPDEPAAGGDE